MSIASGYAKAFVEIAKAENALGVVSGELASLANAFGTNPALQQGLTDTNVPADRRLSMVADLLGNRAHKVTVNLVSTLVGAEHGRELPQVVQQFLASAASESGQVSGEVRSAIALTPQQQTNLSAAVKKATGQDVSLTYVVDPSVIGGVITTVGDKVFDGSVKNRLDQLKAHI